ncbi:ChbG/HpnK family deacetylase [Escherichia sp. E4385]|uniref:ChbG/HpnK family deacetylase n=1 Tax=Escherichia sp. E4385 TaxID=2040639 RepID=UPI0030D8421B
MPKVVRDSAVISTIIIFQKTFFLSLLDNAIKCDEKSLEIMCHPGFVDSHLMSSSYCYQRLEELTVLTTPSLKYAIEKHGFHLVSFRNL